MSIFNYKLTQKASRLWRRFGGGLRKLDNIFFLLGITAFVIMAMQLDIQEVVDGVKRAGYWFPLVILLWALLYIINTTSWGVIIRSLKTSPDTPPNSSNTPPNPSNRNGQRSRLSRFLRLSRLNRLKRFNRFFRFFRLNRFNRFFRLNRFYRLFRRLRQPQLSEISARSEVSEREPRIGNLFLYKVTVAGFALNYATPGGLMGGEAYRISQLTPLLGIEKATSSVVLYVMTHIFSHFWFWLVSSLLYILMYRMTAAMYILQGFIILFCVAAIILFLKGYKNGIVNSLVNIFSHIPFLRRYANSLISSHKDKLENIDRQISTLHGENRNSFFLAVFLEFVCRVLSSFEIMFILLIITPEITFLDSMLILAFTSLFANMLFFLPLQLGGREGGFMLSVSGLSISASAGVFVALIVRLRELVWTGLGLLLIKIPAVKKKIRG